jgi:hypothetical protein
MKILDDIQLDFSDVLLLPKRSIYSSRSQVSLEDVAAKIVFCSSDSLQHNQFYEKLRQYNNDTSNKATPIILTHRNVKNVLSSLTTPNQG